MQEKNHLFNKIMETAVSRGFDPEGKLRQWHMENTGSLRSLIWADDFLKAYFKDSDKSMEEHKREMSKFYGPLEYLDQYLVKKDILAMGHDIVDELFK